MTGPVIPTHDRSITPGLRFPFERIPPCPLPPGAATRNLTRLSISYDVTRSRPYLARRSRDKMRGPEAQRLG